MLISSSTSIQAYQLRNGGAPARLAILRMIASASKDNRNESTRLSPDDWKGARSTTLKGFEAYFGLLSQGRNGADSVWYAHKGPEFRDERNADCINPRLPRGWFTDSEGRETAHGIVARLTHGRFIAGYLCSDNGERVYFPEVFDDADDAARAADGHAESFAESAREDSERFDAMQKAEFDEETARLELQKAIALRNRPQFGGRAAAREALQALRDARERLAESTRNYEKGA